MVQGEGVQGIEADIQRLEIRLRELKVQYDMFFAGAVPREPVELRRQVERLIRQCSSTPIRKYRHRFHLSSLVARFNSLTELWSKTVRRQEQGDTPAAAVRDMAEQRERTVARLRFSDADSAQPALAQLHAKFVEARRMAGVKKSDVPLQTFLKRISKQAEDLRRTHGCRDVELRVVASDRRILLKARPGR